MFLTLRNHPFSALLLATSLATAPVLISSGALAQTAPTETAPALPAAAAPAESTSAPAVPSQAAPAASPAPAETQKSARETTPASQPVATEAASEQPAAAAPSMEPAAPAEATASPAPAQPSADAADATELPEAAMDGAQDAIEPEVDTPRADLPHDLSPVGMFMNADWVVKGVMSLLALASLITWTVWLAKTLQLAGARGRAKRGLRLIANARTLGEALEAMKRRRGIVVCMVEAAADEVRLSDPAVDQAGGSGLKERVGSVLGRIEARAGRGMSKGTGILATIGSVAPFVGLFGTVWGIMNSFIGISEANTTNLAVVAPGIAEALLATAIGLVAAIPAVIIYNIFARSITAYRQLLVDAAAQVERLVSRDLDFRKVPVSVASAAKIKLVTE